MTDNNSTSGISSKESVFSNYSDDEINGMDEDEFADKLLSAIESEGAILSCEEMDIIERFWEKDRGNRRCALINLTKPFNLLKEAVVNDDGFAEAAAEILACLDPKKYKEITELLENAQLRLMCALASREDCKTF